MTNGSNARARILAPHVGHRIGPGANVSHRPEGVARERRLYGWLICFTQTTLSANRSHQLDAGLLVYRYAEAPTYGIWADWIHFEFLRRWIPPEGSATNWMRG